MRVFSLTFTYFTVNEGGTSVSNVNTPYLAEHMSFVSLTISYHHTTNKNLTIRNRRVKWDIVNYARKIASPVDEKLAYGESHSHDAIVWTNKGSHVKNLLNHLIDALVNDMNRTRIHVGRSGCNLHLLIHTDFGRLRERTLPFLTLQGTWIAPIVFAAPHASAKGLSSHTFSCPSVTCTFGKMRARITGAIQQAPIGLPAALKAFKTSETLFSTSIWGPFTAKLDRFFAAPNPPGRTIA